MSTGEWHTLVFVVFNCVMLALIFRCRPARSGPISLEWLGLCAAWPVFGVIVLFALGEDGANDKSVTIQINQFQVPFEAVTATPDDPHTQKVYFIAGERPENSDLVVRPFADNARAAEFVRDEQRPIVEALATRTGDTVNLSLCRYAYEASREFELAGWEVRYSVDGEDLPPASGERDCSYSLDRVGDAVDIALFRVDLDGQGRPSPKERRSFRISRKESGLNVRLDTPISVKVTQCRSTRFQLLPGVPLTDTIDFLPADAIRPAQIGVGGVNPIMDRAFIGDRMSATDVCQSQSGRFLWPSTSNEDWRVSGGVTRNFIPWFLGFVLAANAIVLFVLRSNWWRIERLEACVVFTLQWLLMLRAIIGAAGLFNNPSLNRASVLLDGGMAFACLPTIAVLMLMRSTANLKQSCAIIAALAALTYIALLVSLDAAAFQPVPLAYLFIVLITAGFRAFSQNPDSLIVQASFWSKAVWRRCLVVLAMVRFLPDIASLKGSQKLFAGGIAVVGLAIMWRMGLWGIGQGLTEVSTNLPSLKERVGPLPLSLLYQPMVMVGFAMMTAACVQEPSIKRVIAIGALWGGALMAVPVLVSDSGIIWIYSWPLAFVLSWLALRSIISKAPAAGALLSLLAAAPLFILALAFYWSSEPMPGPNAEVLEPHLETAIEWNSRDEVRLLRFAAPEKLELLGNRMSFEMMDQAASLEPLVRNFWGRGYLEPSLIKNPVRKYQFNDNLLPVHITWPFGRFGLIALLGFIVVSAAVLVRRIPPKEVSVNDIISLIAATTIAWAAIYMALANLNLMPFTGRNVFLLAVTSGGDAIEGLVMILLATLGVVASGKGEASAIGAPEASDAGS